MSFPFFLFCCPGEEAAMGIIVASPSCTEYLWGALIVLCVGLFMLCYFKGWDRGVIKRTESLNPAPDRDQEDTIISIKTDH